MRHKSNKLTIDRKAGPRKALLRTLAISLIENGKVTTTPTKAKAVQRFVEPLITKGKEKTPHTIRHIESKLSNKKAALYVVNELGPKFSKREGGYTSTMKVGERKGDGAEQVILKFVD